MAKFTIDFTPYTRRDPVKGTRGSYIRKGTSMQSSKRLKEFQKCVAKAMRGKTWRGADKRANAAGVRAAFASAAASCKK